MAVKEKIRIKLRSYDNTLVDAACEKIVAAAKRNGAEVSGPTLAARQSQLRTWQVSSALQRHTSLYHHLRSQLISPLCFTHTVQQVLAL